MNNRSHKIKKGGFSLIELIVAIVLGAFISVMSTGIIINGLGQIRTIRQEERLHSDTTYIHSQMQYWIKRATDIDITANVLTVTLPDASLCIISLSDSNMKVDDGTDVYFLNSPLINVASLTFEQIGKSVRISITLEIGTDSQVLLASRTVVTQRN